MPTDIDKLGEVHDFSVEVARELVFDKKHPWHLNLVSLYGTLIEFAGAMVVAERNNAGIAVRGLFRSFLECFVELSNLAADRNYGNNMQAAYLHEWNKMLKSARDGNPFLASIGELPDLGDQIAANEDKLEKYRADGFRPLQVLERFQLADMEDAYRSIYNMLSSDAHGNIRSLIDRHIEIVDDRDFNVVVYKDYSGEFDHYYDNVTRLLLGAGLKIAEVLETGREKEFKSRIDAHGG